MYPTILTPVVSSCGGGNKDLAVVSRPFLEPLKNVAVSCPSLSKSVAITCHSEKMSVTSSVSRKLVLHNAYNPRKKVWDIAFLPYNIYLGEQGGAPTSYRLYSVFENYVVSIVSQDLLARILDVFRPAHFPLRRAAWTC